MDNGLISKLMLGLNNRRGERQLLHDTHRASSKRKQKHYKIRKNKSRNIKSVRPTDTEDGGEREDGSVGLKVGLSVSAGFLFAAVVGFMIYWHTRQKQNFNILMFEMSQSFSHGDAG